ncbi:hypothetical protein [Catenulispora rubra]|uniref:hypothetical protein n=1 Tax=Catenulispora rubra TaxID=280293 RepID=UPI0018922DA3|nr:hypothetical protein [Catenulispora rubra]
MELRSLAPNARAVVFATVCTFLAVAAHRLMSTTGIPFAAEAFGAVAVFCFARIAAALGERGLASIGLLVGGSQIGLHLLFQAVQDSAGHAASVAAPESMPGMSDMPGMAGTVSGVAAHGSMSGMASGMTGGMTSGMTIAHILAAAVTAWWLRRGEAALFAVVERARAVLGASWRLVACWLLGTRPVRSAPRAMRAVGFDIQRPAVVRALQFTVIRRGPPTAVCQ